MVFMKRKPAARPHPAQAHRKQVKFPAKFWKEFSTAAVTISVVIPFAAGAAGVDQITFTSPPQTIEPSVASARITVEAQDSTGAAVRGSTVCLEISSSSGSGEFSSNATNWSAEPVRVLSLTISSNQYRRNLYYRDSSEGAATLTARAALRPDGSTCTSWKGSSTWSAVQQITVDKNAAAIAAAKEAAAAAEKTSAAPAPKKKTSTKRASNPIASEETDAPVATGASSTPSGSLESTQVAAAGSIFSDSLWWVAALGLVGAGCVAVVLSKKSAKQEWNIIEQKE